MFKIFQLLLFFSFRILDFFHKVNPRLEQLAHLSLLDNQPQQMQARLCLEPSLRIPSALLLVLLQPILAVLLEAQIHLEIPTRTQLFSETVLNQLPLHSASVLRQQPVHLLVRVKYLVLVEVKYFYSRYYWIRKLCIDIMIILILFKFSQLATATYWLLVGCNGQKELTIDIFYKDFYPNSFMACLSFLALSISVILVFNSFLISPFINSSLRPQKLL